jgi:hypothetical protein
MLVTIHSNTYNYVYGYAYNYTNGDTHYYVYNHAYHYAHDYVQWLCHKATPSNNFYGILYTQKMSLGLEGALMIHER